MKHLFAIVALTLIGGNAAALASSGQTCCVCQVGADGESWEKPFFKMGCDAWLAAHVSCSSRTKIESADDLLPSVQSCKGGTVKLGYVGHWSQGESDDFVKKYLAPLADPDQLGASVEYQNTACQVMNDVPYLQQLVQGLPRAEGKYIKIQGSQPISLGEWADILPKSIRAGATIDTREQNPIYPSCKSLESKLCTEVQDREQAVCQLDPADASSLKVLTCTKMADLSGENRILRELRQLRNYRWKVNTDNPAGFEGSFSCDRSVVAGQFNELKAYSAQGSLDRTAYGSLRLKITLTGPDSSSFVASGEIDPANSKLPDDKPSDATTTYEGFAHFDDARILSATLYFDQASPTELSLQTRDPSGKSQTVLLASCKAMTEPSLLAP